MRRKVLAQSVRSVVERLERRTLLTSVGTGTAEIAGTVFYDLNSNGIQDLSEPSIVGAQVFLDLKNSGTLDPGDPVSVTDNTGQYTFTNMAAGTYRVVVIPEPGNHQPAPGYNTVTLADGDLQFSDIAESTSAGFTVTTLSGVVFNDFNQNGIYEPATEEFLAGDTVFLDLNHNGTPDFGEPATTTNNVGFYSFAITPGTYDIRVVPRPDFHQDPPGFFHIAVNPGDQAAANIGENNRTTISGIVFNDLNGNGVLDAGETPVAGETVFLDQNFDGVLEPGIYNFSTGQYDGGEPFAPVLPDGSPGVTDATGQYVFTGLSPGQYRLVVKTNTGMIEDTPGYIDVTVAPSQDLVQNLGEGAAATVSGTVFNDANANGVLDAGEQPLGNQTVFLDTNLNGVPDNNGVGPDKLPEPSEPVTTTDPATGTFTFTNLGPGTYTLRLQVPPGGIATAPGNTSHSYTFTLSAGQSLADQNLGFETPDLAVALLKFPTKPGLTTLKRKATVRVTNVGSLLVDGLVGVNLVATTNPVLDLTTATTIGGIEGVHLILKPGKSKILKIDFTYPPTFPLGAYYISADVVSAFTENNVANNTSAAVGPVQVGPPSIDLALAYASQPPATVDPGVGTALSLLLTNNGNIAASSAEVKFRIYATTSPEIEPTDVVIQTVSFRNVHLRPGKSRVFTLPVPSPANLGARYLIVAVDGGNELGETSLGNNIAIPIGTTTFL